MMKFVAATLLSLAVAGPALAYGPRAVVFDPAAELRRATGSAQFPESTGGFEQQARISQGGSQAQPHVVGSIDHTGANTLVGGSSRFPVLSQDALNHPPTALTQDQNLLNDFDVDG